MSFDLSIDRESPFQPGKPVSPHYFKGRHKSIEKILRYSNNAINFDVQHFFLTGQKGMGKTSLAEFVKGVLEDNKNMLGVYVSNKGNNSLESLATSIIEALLNKIPKNFVSELIENLFKKVESFEFNDAKIKFTPDSETSKNIVHDFPYYLNSLIQKLDNYSGIFLIIDDINGLSEDEKFVNWYKRFADTIEVDDDFKFPLYILFAGYPEKFDNLVIQDASFGRIFHHEEITRLTDDDVCEFFKDTFESIAMSLDNDALEVLTLFSQGSPLMMQHIGDAVFWQADDDIITKNVATAGVLNAANELGNKQIRPVLNQIKNKYYEKILLKLGKNQIFNFKKSEFEELLSDSEKNVFEDFLLKMTDINILSSAGFENSGEYEFSNILYFTYFMIKAYVN